MKTPTQNDPPVALHRLVRLLQSVLEYAERETCTHEETHRGGAIWEICDSCGKKWADDEGGKPDGAHDLPQVLIDARDFLHSLPNVQEHATPLAGASVERGVEVHVTGEVENRAASGGCCASPCSPS